MTVAELIEELKKMPPDAGVWYFDSGLCGEDPPCEAVPEPGLCDDGSVQL